VPDTNAREGLVVNHLLKAMTTLVALGLFAIAVGLLAAHTTINPAIRAPIPRATTTVTGTVTYQGKAVDVGIIEFLVDNEPGVNCTASIQDGKYRASGVTPGKNWVVIRSPETILRMPGKKPTFKRIGDNRISVDAAGNNQLIDIPCGSIVLDFDLREAPNKR
jgi:hypothetical protein